ncbi:MAG TPA: DUF4064 domain-containing protein, partial [Bacillus sp. (in: firmicutes)]|nr:DUF4064 domain-containing protein [Bacillus sp. (in: firmicutes)]
MKRTTEFVLGLLGGIFGIIGAFIALFIGGVDAAINGSSNIIGLGWTAVILSILGIVGSVVVKGKPKLGGIFMLVAGIGGFICVSFAYILSGVLLIIAGVMGVFRKDKTSST